MGDLVDVELLTVDATAGTATVRLEQTPLLEGAVVALDNRTGHVLAMVGGFSFARSKFNRATQALRQIGSTFKPILYTAAIDRGLTPATVLVDEPHSFDAGAGQPPYTPRNYDGKFDGPLTLRTALERSRNIPAVKVMEMLGPAQVVPYAARFGLPGDAAAVSCRRRSAPASRRCWRWPRPTAPSRITACAWSPTQVLSVADREGVAARGAHARGPRRHPRRHRLRDDRACCAAWCSAAPRPRRPSLDWPLAGKTGTVNDYTDAWFVGFDPDITLGVWLGYDEKKPIGNGETGTTAALPIWIDIMSAYLDGRDRENPPTFDAPGQHRVRAGRSRHRPAGRRGTPQAITEAFIAGTQPTALPGETERAAAVARHRRLGLVVVGGGLPERAGGLAPSGSS